MGEALIVRRGENLDTELATQDDLIAQIATALEGKTGASGGGASVTVGEVTQATSDTSITIADLIGKDNVALMFMDDCSCPPSAMEDSGIVNVIIHGESYSYVVHYSTGLLSGSNDGFINYDKTTGCISYADAYNEYFIAGKYMYVAWSGNSDNSTSSIINFTIAGTSYQAEDGMTWAQWIESDYNTDNFIHDGYVINDNDINYAVGYDGVRCTPSDVIVNNRAYISMPDE